MVTANTDAAEGQRMELRIAVVLAIACLAGCAAPPAPNQRMRDVAIITSGNTMSYSFAGSIPEIVIVEIDGSPTDRPYGPIELKPGPHSVILKCGATPHTSNVTVRAGEIYQFKKVVAPGVKGCVASLSRLRAARR